LVIILTETKNIFLGILAVILGLIVILFPLISVSTFSVIAGIGIIFLGIWILAQAFKTKSLASGIADLIIAIFAIMLGIIFIGDIKAFQFFSSLALYIVGLFVALSGLSSLSGGGAKGKAIGVLGIILGVLFIVIGTYVYNPLVLAVIIGAFLIIAGIMEIFDLFGEINTKKEK
jgi:membrane protein HdeD